MHELVNSLIDHQIVQLQRLDKVQPHHRINLSPEAGSVAVMSAAQISVIVGSLNEHIFQQILLFSDIGLNSETYLAIGWRKLHR